MYACAGGTQWQEESSQGLRSHIKTQVQKQVQFHKSVLYDSLGLYSVRIMTQAYEELQNQIPKQWVIALYKMEQSVRQPYAKEETAISSAYTCKRSTAREIALLYNSQGTSGRERRVEQNTTKYTLVIPAETIF